MAQDLNALKTSRYTCDGKQTESWERLEEFLRELETDPEIVREGCERFQDFWKAWERESLWGKVKRDSKIFWGT